MIRNYLVSALRNFKRSKLFTLINVMGLAIGISASMVIYLIVHYDFSFDRFEKDGGRIYRVVSNYSFSGNAGHSRGTQAPLANAVNNEMQGLEVVVPFRYLNIEKLLVPGVDTVKPKKIRKQKNIVVADAHYFKMLSYKWMAGSAVSALDQPGKVVLTETRARLYFPSLSYSEMIGRQIIYADTIQTMVSGIVQDLERSGNTDFNFQEFISLPTVLNNTGLRKKFQWENWGSCTSDQQLYVKLLPTTKPSAVEAGLNAIYNKYQGKESKENHYTWVYALQPLNDIHFNNQYGTFDTELASKPTLYGLLLVAAFLLLLACINFINLTTAQASQRAKEIGIRKTLGSSKRQLVLQFLGETFLVTFLATFLSILLTPFLLKIFADFIPKEIHFSVISIFRQPDLLGFLVGLVLLVSLLSGFYPALVLSSWQPVQVLKNQAFTDGGKTRKAWVRQTLTISQFFIAQAFIMGTLLVSKQIRFLLDKDLGFKKEAILSFETPGSDTSYSKRLYLLDELRKLPAISMMSLGSDVPASGGTWGSTISFKNGINEIQTEAEIKMGDSNYLRLFHIPLVAGRNILSSDTVKEVLINENYLHVLGFRHPEDAVGKILNWNGKLVPIAGVMKDFHAHPLNMEIRPMIYTFDGKDNRVIIAGLRSNGSGAETKAVIEKMEKAYHKVYPEQEFSYSFLDEEIAGFYKGEQKISSLLKWATGLTVFISCLGLLGLVIYTTNLRTKEIGVRKVLGASVAQVVSTLSKDFLKLVCIAFVLATPVAWWALHKWLQDFAFRTSMSWWVFAIGGLGMIGIAMLTLSIQTIRAARANPVKSLRTE